MSNENEGRKQKIELTGQQIVRLYQVEREKLSIIMQRVQAVQQAVLEMKGTVNALKELGKEKPCSIMVPLGSGVFAEATVQNTEKTKVMLAGRVLLDFQVEKAVKLIEERLKQGSEELQKALAEQEKIVKSINNLAAIIQAAERQAKRG